MVEIQMRYLTKSRFSLAAVCPTKLFYTGKAEYANQSIDDSFLLALADGGFQVGELAKCYFPGGHEIKTLDYEQALLETSKLLQLDNVIIYEAAIATDNLFIRVDILVKKGNRINFYEVKAKSFDPSTKDQFITNKGGIRSEWKKYLYDVAFQKHVINCALPQYTVSANLMLADKTAICFTDGFNQKFRVVKDQNGRRSVSVSETLTQNDLESPILCKVNVDYECDQIYAKDFQFFENMDFKNSVNYFAAKYSVDEKIHSPFSTACASCEFYSTGLDEQAGLKSGKKECWKKQLGWVDADFKNKTALDIWNFRAKGRLIDAGCVKMRDVTEEDVCPKPDHKPGISTSERQWLQVKKYKDCDDSIWIDRHGLQSEMKSWVFPLHFIDFETTMVAIPFNAGRRPYEGVAFQFSHHVYHEDGTIEHYGEYLNTDRGVFPNYEFIRELKKQLENDSGTIFRYSHHENTYLNMIYRQLRGDQSIIPDRDDLCDFIKSVSQSVKESADKWVGDRNMVDLLELVKRYYYDPATNGSNSIKHVLPAMLNSSRFLQEKYSKPLYGASDGITSSNFKNWQWIVFDSDSIVDPYSLLPKMFQDVSDKDMRILSEDDELKNGGAALTAYARMQFEEMTEYEREEIQKALLKYCELDTMAMLMIYENWMSIV